MGNTSGRTALGALASTSPPKQGSSLSIAIEVVLAEFYVPNLVTGYCNFCFHYERSITSTHNFDTWSGPSADPPDQREFVPAECSCDCQWMAICCFIHIQAWTTGFKRLLYNLRSAESTLTRTFGDQIFCMGMYKL